MTLIRYAGQLLKLRELMLSSKMSIYIDERTLVDIAKMGQGEEIEIEEVEEYIEDENDDTVAPKARKSAEQSVKIKECVRLSTVDNFQGEEAEVVLISTVRCNDKGNTGFLKIANRVNVMMSRAKHGMYVFGSAKTVTACKAATVCNMWVTNHENNSPL